MALVVLFLLCLGLESNALFIYDVEFSEETALCTKVRSKIDDVILNVTFTIEVGLCSIAPMILIPIGNLILLIGLRNSSKQFGKTSKSSSKAEVRCVRNLLILTCVQFLFNAPFSFTISRLPPLKPMTKPEQQLLEMAALVVRMSYCVNPILFTFSLDFYRSEVRRMVTACIPCFKANDRQSLSFPNKSAVRVK